MELNSTSEYRRQHITLAQYVRRRNGVPAGASGSLRNMLRRSLGAGTFAGFWRYWNPVFGYYLSRYVYSPLQRALPSALALISTFVICGTLHDLVATAVRESPVFLFTPWFLLLGVGVVLGQIFRVDVSKYSWSIRASVNLAYTGICLALALLVRI